MSTTATSGCPEATPWSASAGPEPARCSRRSSASSRPATPAPSRTCCAFPLLAPAVARRLEDVLLKLRRVRLIMDALGRDPDVDVVRTLVLGRERHSAHHAVLRDVHACQDGRVVGVAHVLLDHRL